MFLEGLLLMITEPSWKLCDVTTSSWRALGVYLLELRVDVFLLDANFMAVKLLLLPFPGECRGLLALRVTPLGSSGPIDSSCDSIFGKSRITLISDGVNPI